MGAAQAMSLSFMGRGCRVVRMNWRGPWRREGRNLPRLSTHIPIPSSTTSQHFVIGGLSHSSCSVAIFALDWFYPHPNSGPLRFFGLCHLCLHPLFEMRIRGFLRLRYGSTSETWSERGCQYCYSRRNLSAAFGSFKSRLLPLPASENLPFFLAYFPSLLHQS